MYSYYDYEITVKRIVAERLQSAERRGSLEIRGELEQKTLARRYWASRKAQMTALKSRLRMTSYNYLNTLRILSPSFFQRKKIDTA